MRPLRLTCIRFFSLSLCYGGLLIFLWLANRPALAASSETVRASYSALVPSGAPFWIAHELKLFEKEGLKVDLIYINAAARVLAAMFAGEIQVALSGVNSLVATQARGADPVAIAGAVNKINVSIFALPEIRAPVELKGKKLGITRFGGLYDFAATYALKQWGLQAGKDVALIQIGDVPSIMSALAANAIQAATLQPPSTIRARQLGYRELLDLSKSDLEYQNTVVISRRSIITKSPDTFRKFIRAYSQALAVFHTDRETTLRVMGRYLRGTDPFILEKSYEAYLQWVPEVPYVSRRGMETAIALTTGVEKGKEVKVDDVVDETFVVELDQQGFYRALYKR
jgi:ABC-type nitrate/sulfonate/bicarbonate transport system substrate-binding protein